MTLVVLPILLPLIGAAVALLLRKWRGLQLGIGFAALGGALAAAVTLLAAGKPAVYQMGAWAAPMGITIVADALSLMFVVMSLFVLIFGLAYAAGAKDKCLRFPGFVPLFLALSTALCGGMLTGDVFNFFVFVELLVISAAVLTAMSDDKSGVEAAWKYFYISTFAGLLLLAASACLYAAYGTLNMADLARLIAGGPSHPLLRPAAAMLLCALLIKAAAVPFHFWQPDFHTVAPTPVSAMLSAIVVKLGVYGVIRLDSLLFLPIADLAQPALMATGFAGILFGGFAAAGTHNLKRVLAYSTLAQVGVIFVALGLGSAAGLTAALVFSVNHALVKSAMLMLAGAVASRAPVKSAGFDAVTGAGRATRLGGYLFILGAMALVGMPPMNGFVSKYMVLTAAAGAPKHAALLVVAVCLASAITLLYTFRAFSRVWWERLPEGKVAKKKGDSILAPLGLLAVALAMGIFPGPLVRLATTTTAYVSDPSQYIAAVLGPSAVPARPVASSEEAR